jgi:hypothetical protein
MRFSLITLRYDFIKQFIENGGIVLDETMLAAVAVEKKEKIKHRI